MRNWFTQLLRLRSPVICSLPLGDSRKPVVLSQFKSRDQRTRRTYSVNPSPRAENQHPSPKRQAGNKQRWIPPFSTLHWAWGMLWPACGVYACRHAHWEPQLVGFLGGGIQICLQMPLQLALLCAEGPRSGPMAFTSRPSPEVGCNPLELTNHAGHTVVVKEPLL